MGSGAMVWRWFGAVVYGEICVHPCARRDSDGFSVSLDTRFPEISMLFLVVPLEASLLAGGMFHPRKSLHNVYYQTLQNHARD